MRAGSTGLTITLVLALALPAQAAPTAPRGTAPQLDPADPTLELASRSTQSEDDEVFTGTGESTSASVSSTGRFVAFTSTATDLTTDRYPHDDQLNVFLYDRDTDEVTLLSRSGTADQTAGDGESFAPIIAADGSRVAFLTSASDVAGLDLSSPGSRAVAIYRRVDDNVFSITRDHDDPSRWSCADLVLAGLSDDGRTVATLGCGGNISPLERATGSFGPDLTIFPDLNDAAPVVVTTAEQDGERRRTGGVTAAVMSPDGDVVAFQATDATFADAQHTANGTTGGDTQLYGHDVDGGATRVLSADPATNRALAQGDTLGSGALLIPHEHIALDDDGSHVAFTATMADPFGATRPTSTAAPTEQVFLRRRDEIVLASATPDGAPGNGHSQDPDLDEFGVVMSFSSTATDLTRAAQPDATTRVHVRASDFVDVLAPGARSRVSADSRHVAFVSVDDDVVPGDRGDSGPPNSSLDLFLHDRHTSTTRLVTRPGTPRPSSRQNPLPGDNPLPDLTTIAFSEDSSTLAFTTTHDDLIGDDRNDAEDVFVVATASTAPSRTAVTVHAIEVTQGVQNWRNGVDVVAGRRTWVRVHASSDGDAFRTTGRLRGVNFTTGEELGRIRPAFGEPPGTAFLDATPSRSRLRQSLLFELPDDWTRARSVLLEFSIGGRTVTCEDPDADCAVITTFDPQAVLPVQLIGVQVADADDGTAVRPDAETMARAALEIRRALPVADPLITHPFDFVPLIDASPGDASGSTRLALIMRYVRWRYGCQGPQPNDCVVAGVVGRASLDSGGSSVVGKAPLGGDALWAQVTDDAGTVLAHELAHVLGRRHTASNATGGCGGNEQRTDPDYPYDGGRLANADTGPLDASWGTEVHRRGGAPTGITNLFDPVLTGDLMTYCVTRWPSDHTWRALKDGIFSRFDLPAGTAGQRATSRQEPPARQPVISVGAIIEPDGTWTVTDVRSLNGVPQTPPPDGATAVELEVLDADGAVLAAAATMVPLAEEGEPLPFFAVLPRPAGAAAVRIVQDGQEVSRLAASATAPTVAIDDVAQADGALHVGWTVDDPDQQATVSDLEYSPDDGATWQPIGIGAGATGAQANLDAIPGGPSARVRVVVSDGFHSTTATSEPFVVDGHAPTVVVTPAVPTTTPADRIRLEAHVRDLEDGMLHGPAVRWASDVDGPLGEGTDLEVTGLTPGRHVLTATATDSDGASASATTTTLVLDAAPVRLAGPTRLETAVEISRASYADGAAGAAVVARADGFADTLAGTPLAVAIDAPILLSATDGLSAPTAVEIERILPPGGAVHLLGGAAALGPQVEADLVAQGYAVTRHAGPNRFATATQIAEALEDPAEIVLADGRSFAEPLVAASLAGSTGGMLLLTDGDRLPDETRTALDQHAGLATTAVGAASGRAVPAATQIAGETPASTATAVAAARYTEPVSVGVASLEDFPDALGAAVHMARQHGPLMLTGGDALDSAVTGYLTGLLDAPAHRWLYGGEAALSPAVETALGQAR